MPSRSTLSRDLLANETVADWLSALGITPTSYQPTSAELTALAALASTGFLSRTATATYAQRTIAGTSNEISVANGDGVSGNPTLSLPSTLALRGKAVQVQDNNFTIADDGDSTKLVAFEASGLTTGTTRTITVPDKSGTLAMTSDIVAGGLTAISSGSFGAVASLAFTSIPATYAYLVLQVTGVSSNTDTRHPQVQVSTNNGSAYDTTANHYVSSTGTMGAGHSEASLFDTAFTDQAKGVAWSFAIYIYGYQGGVFPTFTVYGVDVGGVGDNPFAQHIYIGSTSAINALKILWNGSGNFDAGSYALYGAR